MNDAEKKIWSAINILQDYFHRLGGAAVPIGTHQDMRDSVQYVCVRILQTFVDEAISHQLMNPELLVSAKSELGNVDEIIISMKFSKQQALQFIVELITYTDNKITEQQFDKNAYWDSFKEFFKTLNNS